MSRLRDGVVAAVAVVTVVALVSRVVGLGVRPYHWDEARVGFWALRYLETGVYQYRPVAGGPLLYTVTRQILGFAGSSDLTGRLFVAALGGTAPLAALLFRSRLERQETVLLAVVLATAPPLVYYSRFLRGDVPVAVFTLVAFGATLSWQDWDQPRFLYLAAVSAACAFGSSGFAVATAGLIFVAAAITFDHRRVTGQPGDPVDALVKKTDWMWDHKRHLAGAGITFLGTLVALFAPRGGIIRTDRMSALTAAFRDPVVAFVGVRILGRPATEFIPAVSNAIPVLTVTAGPLVAVAALGFLADRYAQADSHRPVVAFSAVWGGLGIIVYPLVAASLGPWVIVHVVTPLAIPAAAGLSKLVDYGRVAMARGDAARLAVAAMVLLSVGSHAGLTATAAYETGQLGDPLVHSAQPVDDLEGIVGEMETAVGDRQDASARVVWVGSQVHTEANLRSPPLTSGAERAVFAERLPLAYYLERAQVPTNSVSQAENLTGDPAVVISVPSEAGVVARQLPDHERRSVQVASDRELVVFLPE